MTPSAAAGLLARKRLLIFDLDGTLVDSSPLHARAFQEAFASYGIDVDYASIAGLTTTAAVDRVASQAGLELSVTERQRLIAEKQASSLRLIKPELRALEGAVESVRAAEGRFGRALCTSASRAGADAALAKVGLAGQFDLLITAEMVGRGKPDPEGFLMALKLYGAHAAEALVFEDSESGLAAAAAAEIEAVQIKSDSLGRTSWAPFVTALELGQ